MRNLFLLLVAFITYKQTPAQNNRPITESDIVLKSVDTKLFPCLNPGFRISQQEQIINSEQDYKRLKNQFHLKCSLPSINFKTQTMLGYFTMADNYCNIEYTHSVFKDSLDSSYVFVIGINKLGHCKRESNGGDWHWVIVPKLPLNYKVKFKSSITQDGK